MKNRRNTRRGRAKRWRFNGDFWWWWGRHEPPPGQEYTRLTDEDAARRDRARYCHATGTGPRWARELGAAMARGEA